MCGQSILVLTLPLDSPTHTVVAWYYTAHLHGSWLQHSYRYGDRWSPGEGCSDQQQNERFNFQHTFFRLSAGFALHYRKDGAKYAATLSGRDDRSRHTPVLYVHRVQLALATDDSTVADVETSSTGYRQTDAIFHNRRASVRNDAINTDQHNSPMT